MEIKTLEIQEVGGRVQALQLKGRHTRTLQGTFAKMVRIIGTFAVLLIFLSIGACNTKTESGPGTVASITTQPSAGDNVAIGGGGGNHSKLIAVATNAEKAFSLLKSGLALNQIGRPVNCNPLVSFSCSRLAALSPSQLEELQSVLRQSIDTFAAFPFKTKIEIVQEVLTVTDSDGTKRDNVVAVTNLGPNGNIKFNASHVDARSADELLSVLVHEAGHQLLFPNEGYVKDGEQYGHLRGSQLLDLIGDSIVIYYNNHCLDTPSTNQIAKNEWNSAIYALDLDGSDEQLRDKISGLDFYRWTGLLQPNVDMHFQFKAAGGDLFADFNYITSARLNPTVYGDILRATNWLTFMFDLKVAKDGTDKVLISVADISGNNSYSLRYDFDKNTYCLDLYVQLEGEQRDVTKLGTRGFYTYCAATKTPDTEHRLVVSFGSGKIKFDVDGVPSEGSYPGTIVTEVYIGDSKWTSVNAPFKLGLGYKMIGSNYKWLGFSGGIMKKWAAWNIPLSDMKITGFYPWK